MGAAMRCVIFDLDGTLADTSQDLLAAANGCFRDLGHGEVLDHARDAGTALRGGRAMLRAGFARLGLGEPVQLIDAQYPALLAHYDQAVHVHTTLYPGAMDAVEQLRSDGFIVGICTNKPEGLAEKLMQSLGVRDAFAALLGADTLPVRKPDPEHLFETCRRAGGDPTRAILVGDTETDHKTARAAGAASVLVTFGPGKHAVEAMEPDALLHDYADLPDIAARLLA
jgi:phosphoglycolate phosphatase